MRRMEVNNTQDLLDLENCVPKSSIIIRLALVAKLTGTLAQGKIMTMMSLLLFYREQVLMQYSGICQCDS
jgi:hypothetical protein